MGWLRRTLLRLSGEAARLRELEERNRKLLLSAEQYRTGFARLNEALLERTLYREMVGLFARADTFDRLFTSVLDSLSHHLKARYYGIFLLNSTGLQLEYRCGRGLRPDSLPPIPRDRSLMGRALSDNRIIAAPDLKVRPEGIPLNQDPPEYNAVAAPIHLLGKPLGAVRLSNLDPEHFETARESMAVLVPLMTAGLERLLYMEQSEQQRKSLDAAYSIARVLERTLEETAIYPKICESVAGLFPVRAALVVAAGPQGNRAETLAAWPAGYTIGNNPESSEIILRNLFSANPEGAILVPDLHQERRLSWPDPTVRSICAVVLARRKDDTVYLLAVGPAAETYAKPQLNLLGLAASQAALTLERAAHFREQEFLARRDGLTGLFNHRVFQETVREEIGRARRYNRPLSLVMIDFDRFKDLNDRFGHPVGDQVIRRVAETLKRAARTTDRVFRYGGEEFCLLLTETPIDKAQLVADRLRMEIATDESDGPRVTASMGVAVYKSGEKPQDFIERADRALYEAKNGGRDRVVVRER